jgi:hypothetical protein
VITLVLGLSRSIFTRASRLVENTSNLRLGIRRVRESVCVMDTSGPLFASNTTEVVRSETTQCESFTLWGDAAAVSEATVVVVIERAGLTLTHTDAHAHHALCVAQVCIYIYKYVCVCGYRCVYIHIYMSVSVDTDVCVDMFMRMC